MKYQQIQSPYMKQKSVSLGALPYVQNSSPKFTHLNYHSRLQFPIVGDTRFYSNSGRKHYENHSNRVLKIILPREYPLREPIHSTLPRQNSLPPPHLQTLTNCSPLESPTVVPKTSKASNLYGRIQDQLDRMKAQMQRQKISVFVSRKFQKVSEDPRQQSQLKLKTVALVKEAIVPASEPKRQKSGGYLLRPVRDSKELKMESQQNPRARNPSFLSSGLSIV